MTLLPYLRRAMLALVIAVVGLSSLVLWQAGSAQGAPARDLAAKVSCSQSILSVTFTWASSDGDEQWLDLALVDGFAPGSFTSSGPISPRRESLDWNTAAPNTTYYARINTLDNNTWAASSTLSFTTPACGTAPPAAPAPTAPAPTGPAPSAGMLALQTSLEQQIAAVSYKAAVAVTDLQTGETISVNGSRQQLTGCVINLFALMQAVIDVQNGQYPESAVGELISATIYGSNPVTAKDILAISGNGDILAAERKVNDLISRLGLTSTFYDHPPAYWPSYALRGQSNLTTALDMNKALVGFWNGSAMSIEWRDYLYEKMQGVKPGLNYLIPAGVDGGVTGHKNGFLSVLGGWVDNDTGIVTFQRGGQTYAYAITFLTEGVPVKYGDITLGQTVSSLAWQYFSTRYP